MRTSQMIKIESGKEVESTIFPSVGSRVTIRMQLNSFSVDLFVQ